MSPFEGTLLFISAALAGALNSVAGGGSFISFPALLFTGVAPVAANATNSVALWPAGVASAFAYRSELTQPRATLVALALASFVGGVAGALLLLWTSDTTFVHLLPFLLLVATLVFTFGGMLTARLRSNDRAGTTTTMPLAGAAVLQLAIALYGGYFGGGMGIMMLATLSLMGMTNIHAMNGLKTVLGTVINGVAVVAFIVAGAVTWGPGLVMIVGATAGGYAGAAVARKLDPRWVRRFVLAIAWGMTIYFFAKTYAR
jgi:uncharacterized membrane protein YfcA